MYVIDIGAWHAKQRQYPVLPGELHPEPGEAHQMCERPLLALLPREDAPLLIRLCRGPGQRANLKPILREIDHAADALDHDRAISKSAQAHCHLESAAVGL